MEATLKAARAVAKEIARIDAKIRKKLLKRARKHSMTARSMKHLHLEPGQHKAH
jgi:hypothetical protein